MDTFLPRLLSIEITASDETRGYWLDQPTSPADRRAELLSAAILVVPSPANEGETPTFPTGTGEFITDLRALMGAEFAIAVASTDADYRELTLHAKAWRLPKMLITTVALPLFLGVLANELDKLLPGHAKGDIAEATILVETPNHRILKLQYKGDPTRMADYFAREVPAYLQLIDPEAPPLQIETGAPDATDPDVDEELP